MLPLSLSQSHIIAVVLFLCMVLFEVLFPFRRHVRRVRHYGKNVVFSLMNIAVLGLSGAAGSIWLFLWIEDHQVGLLNMVEMPFWLMVLAASLIFDAWTYAWHRLNHEIPFLWRFHQVHHNDLEMDMSTAFRFHPGETLLRAIFTVGVYIIFGITIELIVWYKFAFNFSALFHHCNIALPARVDRLLQLLFVSPNMHRVHHSMKMEETNSNYSTVLTLWDRLFGTFRQSDPSKIVFGLEYDRKSDEQSFKYLLLRPFKHRQTEEFPQEDHESNR